MFKKLERMKRFILPPPVTENLFASAYDFCASICRAQGIDSSHDEHHMTRVAQMTERLNILSGCAVTQEEKDVMILSAFTHDLCDHKYTDVSAGLEVIDRWLEKQPISEEQRRAVCRIISTMSYSKVKVHGYPTDLGRWELAYHHTRIADLIDAYDIDRCYQYQSHKHPTMEETDKWRAVIDIFERRILTQKDEFILPIAPYAADIVEARHTVAAHAIQQFKKLV
jgi:HD superfamily phosphodiesterase